MSGIKNNKGKFIVLLVYILFVFVSPLYTFTPYGQKQLRDMSDIAVRGDTDREFRQIITLLQKEDTQSVYNNFMQSVRSELATSSLERLASMFASTSNDVILTGSTLNKISESSHSTTTISAYYELTSTDPTIKYLLVNIIALDKGSGLEIWRIQAIPEPEPITEKYKFNLSSQGIYLFFSFLIPALVVYTAYRYITRGQKPRWITFLVILFGTLFFYFSGGVANFTFGARAFAILASKWGPWVFATPLPIGSIYYLIRRKKYENPPLEEGKQ